MLTVLLLGCKRLPYLQKTLSAVRAHFSNIEPGIKSVWVCFDNGSSIEDRKRLEEMGFDVLFLSRENLGLGPAMNRLVAAVRTPYLLNLQDDWLLDNPFSVPFAQESIRILESDRKLAHVKLDACHFLDFDDRSIYSGPLKAHTSGVAYYVQNPSMLWGGFTFPPGITRTAALHEMGPFLEDQPFRRGWAESEYSARFSSRYHAVKSPDMLLFEHIGEILSPGWTGRPDAPRDNPGTGIVGPAKAEGILDRWLRESSDPAALSRNPSECVIERKLLRKYSAPSGPPKILFAGPWVGEFGWELCRWQGGVRKLVKEQFGDRYVVVAGDAGHHPFYEYAHEYWSLPAFVYGQGLLRETQRLLPKDRAMRVMAALHGMLGRQLTRQFAGTIDILPPRRFVPEEQTFVRLAASPESLRERDSIVRERGFTHWICVFPRKRPLNPQKNWPEDNWNKLMDLVVTRYAFGVVLLGREEDTSMIERRERWFVSTAAMSAQERTDLGVAFLSGAVATIGSESGGPFLSLMCGCPTLVMGGPAYEARYVSDENPLGTECRFLAKAGYQHSYSDVAEEVVRFIDKHMTERGTKTNDPAVPREMSATTKGRRRATDAALRVLAEVPPKSATSANDLGTSLESGEPREKLKIAVVGVFNVPHSDNIFMADAFEGLGHEVVRYDFRKRAAELGGPLEMQEELLAEFGRARYGLAVFSKFERTSPDILLRYNQLVPTYLWFPDWEPNIGPDILAHFRNATFASCTGLPVAQAVERKTGRKVWHVFDGAAPEVFHPVTPEAELACDVVFIGQRNPKREHYLELVRSAGFDCQFRGPGFEQPVYLDRFSAACCSGKVNLGIHYGHWDGLFFSVRTWMTMACGGFYLIEYVPGLETIFERGRHLDWFRTEEELLSLLDRYIRAPNADQVRRRIADEGRRLVLDRYTWKHTAEQILKIAFSSKTMEAVR